jgi:hypothetical protein
MKQLLFSLFVILTSLASCKKIKEVTYVNFEITYRPTVEVSALGLPPEVQLPPGGVSASFPAFPFATNIQTYLDQYDIEWENVVEVTPLRLTLEVIHPNHNFDYVDSVQVFLSAPNLPEVMIAYSYTVPKGKMVIYLQNVQDLNLKDYFLKETVYYRINTHINKVPAGEQFTVSSIFHLKANQLI